MKTLILIIALATISFVGYPQSNAPAPSWAQSQINKFKPDSGDLFGKNEFQLDLAGTWTVAEPQGIEHLLKQSVKLGDVGLSLSGTKFFNRYVGGVAELSIVDLYNPGNMLIDELSIGGVARVPIGRFAPYAKVLVGRDFHTGIYNFQFGPGVEVRLNQNFGVFTEARYQVEDNSKNDRLRLQAGVSIVF